MSGGFLSPIVMQESEIIHRLSTAVIHIRLIIASKDFILLKLQNAKLLIVQDCSSLDSGDNYEAIIKQQQITLPRYMHIYVIHNHLVIVR